MMLYEIVGEGCIVRRHIQSVHSESAGRKVCMVGITSSLYVIIDRTKYIENRRPNEFSNETSFSYLTFHTVAS